MVFQILFLLCFLLFDALDERTQQPPNSSAPWVASASIDQLDWKNGPNQPNIPRRSISKVHDKAVVASTESASTGTGTTTIAYLAFTLHTPSPPPTWQRGGRLRTRSEITRGWSYNWSRYLLLDARPPTALTPRSDWPLHGGHQHQR
ncbi:hypothetical protein C8R46DRAFT_1067375 [Mycena filopes]|nr:hypothetical protein C8R46DRAFT_1067375 [Mycena filopes]